MASNNIAVCCIFINQNQKAIDTLTELIKTNSKSNVTEQLVSNLIAFYEVHYPASEKTGPSILQEQKSALLETCMKRGTKDAVMASNHFASYSKQ